MPDGIQATHSALACLMPPSGARLSLLQSHLRASWFWVWLFSKVDRWLTLPSESHRPLVLLGWGSASESPPVGSPLPPSHPAPCPCVTRLGPPGAAGPGAAAAAASDFGDPGVAPLRLQLCRRLFLCARPGRHFGSERTYFILKN